jgi:magnesium transporter
MRHGKFGANQKMEILHITENGAISYDQNHGQPSSGFCWIDCHYHDVGQLRHIVPAMTGIELLEEHLQDAGNRNHPSFFDNTSHYEMIVFRGLAIFPGSIEVRDGAKNNPIAIKTRPSTFFLVPGALITVRASDSRTFVRLRDRMLHAQENGARIPRTPEELLLRILNDMVDRYLDLREPLSNRLHRFQQELLDPKRAFNDWHMLLSARMEIRKLEALCEEQLDAMQEWLDARHDAEQSVCGGQAIGDNIMVRTTNVIEHINRVLNHTRRLESTIESAVQLHFSATAHRSTEIMRVLTILTAIFMPLTLISGIFGMNFKQMPLIDSPHGFWYTVATMATIALVMYGWFHFRRWVNTRGSDFSTTSADSIAEDNEVAPADDQTSARARAKILAKLDQSHEAVTQR